MFTIWCLYLRTKGVESFVCFVPIRRQVYSFVFFFFEEEEEEGMMMTCLVLVDSFFMRLQGVSTERANEPSHVRMRVSCLRAISSF